MPNAQLIYVSQYKQVNFTDVELSFDVVVARSIL